jgi:8-oxo-dGTP diphosphatase
MATNSSVAVLVVIFTVEGDDLQVLLIHRSADPFEGYWAIPGGFLADGENLDEAAVRKLRDETGLHDVYLEQLYTFHDLDERNGVAVAYFALVHRQNATLAPREAWRPGWYPVRELPPLAFHNDQVIEYALRRLQAKLDYTNVAYSLLPEYFTLSQLQRVYESILNRKLDKRNFRKRILSLGLLTATDRHVTDGAHRPARLYAFKERQHVII